MAGKKRLGKGLQELLGGVLESTEGAEAPETADKVTPSSASTIKSGGGLREIPVERIVRSPYQPRRDMDPVALEELANSIRAQGVLQPIVVRALSENQFELVAGERRWRAAQLAGLERIPVVVKPLTDEAALAVALIENVQRENLNPMEEAHALTRLAEEFELTHQEVADAVGKSRSGVTNLLRLMDLNDDVKRLLEHGDIEMGHARALLGLSGNLQTEIARTIVARRLSVRETETLIRGLKNDVKKAINKVSLDPDILRLERELSETLGTHVNIKHSTRGSGSLVIRYSSVDELDGILSNIKQDET